VAQDQPLGACESDVVIQADDWLSKLADKFYGDPLAFPAIAGATNAMAAKDGSYATITDPNVIEVGWKLCIPSTGDAEALVGEYVSAAEASAMSTGEEATVVFWNVWGGTRAPLLREILDQFEAENPGIKVQNVTLDGKTDQQKMLTAVAAGEPPDIYMTHTNDLSMWASLDAFLPLNNFIEQDGFNLDETFFPGAVQGSTFDGNVIQFPFKIPSALMIWYNKELFQEAGLDPDNPPQTWQELEAAAQTLTKMDGETIEQLGLNVCINCLAGPEDPYVEWLSRNGGLVLTPDGKDVAFDSERGLETMVWMKSMMDNSTNGYANMVAQMGTDWPDQRPVFYAGKIAMHMDGPWFFNILREEAPDMVDKVGVFLLPINGENPDSSQKKLAHGIPGYAIPKDAKNPEAAWQVLKYIATNGGCEFFLRQGRTDTPLLTCAGEDARAENPFFDTFVAAVGSVEAVKAPPTYSQIHKRLKEMEESVLLGNETPEEGIQNAAADLRQVLAE
jgi:multiple sugar transport system substrate-binding protein